MESANFLERVAGGDRVNEEEAFTSAHVLLAHGSVKSERQGLSAVEYHSPVFLLTSGVEDVEQCDLFINDALLAVRVYVTILSKDSNGREAIIPSIVGSYSSTK